MVKSKRVTILIKAVTCGESSSGFWFVKPLVRHLSLSNVLFHNLPGLAQKSLKITVTTIITFTTPHHTTLEWRAHLLASRM